MSFKKYIERIKRIDRLIRLRATGTPKELSQKINISDSLLYEILSEMKELGAIIVYDKTFKTYYYKEPVEIDFAFRPINKAEK
jgi:hypothetical protein